MDKEIPQIKAILDEAFELIKYDYDYMIDVNLEYKQEIERLQSIIKEVREYVMYNSFIGKYVENDEVGISDEKAKHDILEILDKGE